MLAINFYISPATGIIQQQTSSVIEGVTDALLDDSGQYFLTTDDGDYYLKLNEIEE